MKRILVTGAAGFIGYHVAAKLLERGAGVIGIDNLSPYYDVTLKRARLALLEKSDRFQFRHADIADRAAMAELFRAESPELVIHLAAQPGVRYSLQDPFAYVDSNLNGFMCIMEGCRQVQVRHLVFASSSSVYGASAKSPLAVGDPVDFPISLYAATKKANEEIAHSYSHLYGIPATGLRFFTVYGPWGRPDMAYFSFTKAIIEGRPLELYNYGEVQRDFTFIDDIVDGVLRVADKAPSPGRVSPSSTSEAPFRLYNIGNHAPVSVGRLVDALEKSLGRRAERRLVPQQPGDVQSTFADVEPLARDFDFTPSTPVEEGLARFVAWYKDYYDVDVSKPKRIVTKTGL